MALLFGCKAGNLYTGTSTALPGLIGDSITALKARCVPAIPGPVEVEVSNDWCIGKGPVH